MHLNKLTHAGHHLGFFAKGVSYSGLTLFIAVMTGLAGCGVVGLTMLDVDILTSISLDDGFEDLANATIASANKTHENLYKTFHHCPVEG